MAWRIPFNRPFVVGRELFYIAQAVMSGHLAGDGEFTARCHRLIEERFGVRKALLTHSCTAALEAAALLCKVGPGDEVVMPSFTFVSTPNAFALRGATIRFVDIRRDTLNLDESQLEAALSPRTKAIVPVHYAGVACEMDVILETAARAGALVVEDAAQGVGASYKGRPLGTLGQLAAYSFHETKNFISGEGGALLVNDAALVERAEIVREKGTNRAKFHRGEVDKYTWLDLGSSYLPSEIVAAFLAAQLEEMDRIAAARWAIYRRYQAGLADAETRELVRLPHPPAHYQHNAHIFFLILPDQRTRDGLIAALRAREILAVSHYVPLHTSPMGAQFGNGAGSLPVTEELCNRLVRLPAYFGLTVAQQDEIIGLVHAYLAGL